MAKFSASCDLYKISGSLKEFSNSLEELKNVERLAIIRELEPAKSAYDY